MRSWLLIPCALSASGCWVSLQTGKQMQADIAVIQTELTEARRDGARLDEQLRRADEVLQELSRAARMTDADFGVQIERLTKEVQELRGHTELADHRISKLENTAPSPSSAPPPAGGAPGLANATPTDDPAKPQAAEADLPKGKKELLAHAQKLEKQNELNEARGVYRQVIKQWPKEAGIADTAYYALGESYFNEKRHRNALQEYIKIVEQFPSGKLADKAYFRIGQCSLELGALEDAEIFFNEIVTNHKKSPLLKEATSKLADVRKRMAKEKKPSGKK